MTLLKLCFYSLVNFHAYSDSTFSRRTPLSHWSVYKCIIKRESKPFQTCCSQLVGARSKEWCSSVLSVTSSYWPGWQAFPWNSFLPSPSSALMTALDIFYCYYSYSKDQFLSFLWPSYYGTMSTHLLTKGTCKTMAEKSIWRTQTFVLSKTLHGCR